MGVNCCLYGYEWFWLNGYKLVFMVKNVYGCMAISGYKWLKMVVLSGFYCYKCGYHSKNRGDLVTLSGISGHNYSGL